ncbi:MAG TPA: DUF3325 domain-containing protein [Limnobacter sp.]|nr:DUF3325 domain-containing protein [Limnobacter sp.]
MLSFVGMAWLALSMDVHWSQVKAIALHESEPPRRMLKALACTSLCAALLACWMADRPSIAVLVWVMLVIVSAVAVALQLSRAPKLLNLVWPSGGGG